MPKRKPDVVVAHLGARLHYAVASLLHEEDYLSQFFTDSFLADDNLFKSLISRLPGSIMPEPLKKLRTRTADIPSSRVTAFHKLGLRYLQELRKSGKSDTDIFYDFNRSFGKQVADHPKLKNADLVYGFTGSSLEIFEEAKKQGAVCILEQMSAPVATSNRVISNEYDNWSGWQTDHSTLWDLAKWEPRQQAEWELADCIIAPSRYVAEELKSADVSESKIETLPFAVSTNMFPQRLHTFDGKRPLRILYIGGQRLLKGVPYLLEALTSLPEETFEAVLIGQNHFSDEILSGYNNVMTHHSQIPRNELIKWYDWADLFVMPSLCEGSATVNYEARASGLPAIATETSGTWIEDKKEGLIVPPRDSQAIAEAIKRFLDTPEIVEEMSKQNLQNLEPFRWKAYKRRLISLVDKLN